MDASGKVTSVSTGTATITATAKDGSKKKASCTVTVKKARSQTVTTHTHKWVAETTQMWVDENDVNQGYFWFPELNSTDICGIAEEDMDAIRKFITWKNQQMVTGNWQNTSIQSYKNTHAGYLPKARTVTDCVKCRTAGKPVSEYRFLSDAAHIEHINQMGEEHAAYNAHDQWFITIIIRQKCSCGLTKGAYD